MSIDDLVYEGPVVFTQGSHFIAVDGHADLTQPLILCEDGKYHFKNENDPTHRNKYSKNHKVILGHPNG